MCSTPAGPTLAEGNVMAVGAHWDDIELGCALTLNRLAESRKVYGVVLTHSGYKFKGYERSATEARREGHKAFAALGIEPAGFYEHPTEWLKYDRNLMKAIEDLAVTLKVSVAFIPSPDDHNTDHQATYEICRVAFRHVPSILLYRSNNYHDALRPFVPQVFFGFTIEEYQKKRDTLGLYKSEWDLRLESWQDLMDQECLWGNCCGCDYAEAFMISRISMR